MRRFAVLLLLLPAAAAGADDDPGEAVDRAIAGWDAACPGPTADGACTRSRTTSVKGRCAPTAVAVEVPRSAKAARTARAALTAALAALDKHPDAAQPTLAAAAARGRGALAEIAYEDFHRLRFPAGLDFSGRGRVRSQKRFTSFLEEATKKLDAAIEAYRVASLHPAATRELRLRALARTGQLSARFVELLLGGEIPRDVRRGPMAADKVAAYCDALEEHVGPMEERARAAFEDCRAAAAGQAPWATLCDP